MTLLECSSFAPSYVESGDGSFLRLPRLLAQLGTARPLLVVDTHVRSLVIDLLAKIDLGSFVPEVLTAPPGEPTTETADDLASLAKKGGFDGVVAVGGGSVMDLGKAISVLVGRSCSAASMQRGDVALNAGLPTICIPTTAGSGAEATKSAVLIDPKRRIKRGINGPEVLPRGVILDPSLLKDLPRRPKVAALLDATAHAVESHIGRRQTIISRASSNSALPLLGQSLRELQENPSTGTDLGMLWGAFLAGVAICNSETGPVHALSYPISEMLGIPHGEAVGVLLPVVMHAQQADLDGALEACAALMGFASSEAFLETCRDLASGLEPGHWIDELIRDEATTSVAADRAIGLSGAIANAQGDWDSGRAAEVYRALRAMDRTT